MQGWWDLEGKCYLLIYPGWFLSLDVTTNYEQKSKLMKEGRVYLVYNPILLTITSIPWQEFRNRSCCRDHGEVLSTVLIHMTCSGCLILEPRTTMSEMAPHRMGWALLHWSLIKKILRAEFYAEFAQTRLLPPWWLSLFCSWHKMLSSTLIKAEIG